MVGFALVRPLPRHRLVLGFCLAAGGLPALTALLAALRTSVNLSSILLLFVALVVFVAVAGGPWPALLAAVSSPLLINYYLTPPLRTFAIEDPNNVLALLLFVVVAAVVSIVVVVLENRTEQVREAVLTAAAAQVAIAGDRTRTALLAAVSHDLRSPLASAKASIDSLLSTEVSFGPQDTHDLLATADESIDRLIKLVEDLLEMSRLQAGALAVAMQEVPVPGAVDGAVEALQVPSGLLELAIAPDSSVVWADDVLLERVLANLIANALRFSPSGLYPEVTTHRRGDQIEIRVVDRGPGVPTERHTELFQPFQRLGDTDVTTGVGLGLAIAHGLAEAMSGHLHPEHTPGGGMTMVLTLQTGPHRTA